LEFFKLLKKPFSLKTAKQITEKQQLPGHNFLDEFEEESIKVSSISKQQNSIEEIDPKIVLGEYYDPIIKIRTSSNFQQKRGSREISSQNNLIQRNSNLCKCKHNFGYLNTRIKGTEIPKDCIICEKVIECMHFTN
jgi:hypothetical protein